MTYNAMSPATLLATLPDAPCPSTSDKYAFIDTKRVVADMRDLGYEVAAFRRPRFRTQSGAYGLHEVDFRLPKDIEKPAAEVPRVLFLNTYDGSRRAQIITGVFRLVCLNGLIAGSTLQNEKFLHLGDYEEELLGQIRSAGQVAAKAFDQIETFKEINLDEEARITMARKAIALRLPEDTDYELRPEHVLLPRRREDAGHRDLWTNWNITQENLMKGGIPAIDGNGDVRTMRALTQIQRSNQFNRDLWDLLEETAAAN